MNITDFSIKYNTPSQLFKFCTTKLEYYGVNKGRVWSPDEVLIEGKGHCWEVSGLINRVCSDNYIESYSIYFESKDCIVTHMTNIIKTDGGWIVFETIRNDLFGISEKFNTKSQAIFHIYKILKRDTGTPDKFLIGNDIPCYLDSEDSFYYRISTWQNAI